jgi:uncharacterized sodium:solute symporter family permease YidK
MWHDPRYCITCRAEAAARKAALVADVINAVAVIIGLLVIVGFALLFGGR